MLNTAVAPHVKSGEHVEALHAGAYAVGKRGTRLVVRQQLPGVDNHVMSLCTLACCCSAALEYLRMCAPILLLSKADQLCSVLRDD